MIFKELHIFDASSVIYAGTLSKYKSDYMVGKEQARLNGLPIGGIRKLINEVLVTMRTGDVIVALDSVTDKSKYDSDYKGTRLKNPDILIQQVMIQEVLADLNIPFIKLENYEADDIIAAVVNKYYDERNSITIHTGDSDIAANLKKPNYKIIGPASIYPTITVRNYSDVLTKDIYVPYNAILPYYFFMGKKSNNVKRLSCVQNPLAEFKGFIEACKEWYMPNQTWSDKSLIAKWYLEKADKEVFTPEQFINRVNVVYPLDIPELPQFNFESPINHEKLAFYGTIFSLENAAGIFGVRVDTNTDLTSDMWAFIMKYKNLDGDGKLAVDFGTSPDMSFFMAEEPEEIKEMTTDLF